MVALLAIGAVVASLALLPLPYPGSVWMIVGLIVEAICILGGLLGLVSIMFRRVVNVPEPTRFSTSVEAEVSR